MPEMPLSFEIEQPRCSVCAGRDWQPYALSLPRCRQCGSAYLVMATLTVPQTGAMPHAPAEGTHTPDVSR